ncbi:probable receptor-like protein kinase At5g18500 [Ziziphus jujuba]|uniref:Probable receptor-like protein kinase At5g18500 n=1 Tax=Ziziphus jujuba TaxID=326968 RepID=A0ABM3I7U6_ZIZJJ|nr:probable receptor-like protein kinase At5g18500 [Ziziphus jujuba]
MFIITAIFDLSFEELHIDRNSITFIGNYKGLSILAGGIAGITLILLALIWILCKKGIKERFSTAREITDVSDDSQPDETSCLKIPRKEVYSATDNLNASNFIGQGVAGKVYKGVLSNGQHVAVKHIIKDGYIDTFIREVRSLSNVRHQNLVALLGYCEDKEECFLVYELCHNGNLSEWLFGKDKFLPWIHRLQIAIDSAKGVCFLHSYPEGCIVHRDIKPTNILINAKFQAKLSDFGLSKVMDLDQSYVSSEVRGTFGYVDPEYRKNHHVNASGDVYSFGMARLLADGRNIEEFADPKLSSEYSMEAFDLVFKLALSCTGLKQQRPSMEQVVQKLEKALNISTQFN